MRQPKDFQRNSPPSQAACEASFSTSNSKAWSTGPSYVWLPFPLAMFDYRRVWNNQYWYPPKLPRCIEQRRAKDPHIAIQFGACCKLRQAPRRDAGSKPKRLEHIIVFQQTFGNITRSGFWGVISDANKLACTGCSRSNFLWTNWTTWTMSDVRDSSPFWHRSWKFLGDSKMFIYFLGFLDKCLASSSLASKEK